MSSGDIARNPEEQLPLAADQAGQALARLALSPLTVVETDSGLTAAVLIPWELPMHGNLGFARTFGHHLTIASLLRGGEMMIEDHSDQLDEKAGGGISDPYPCVPIHCPSLLGLDGQVFTSRLTEARLLEANLDILASSLGGDGRLAYAIRRLRTAQASQDVFNEQGQDVRFQAMVVADRHTIQSPAAQEAFAILRAGRPELPSSTQDSRRRLPSFRRRAIGS